MSLAQRVRDFRYSKGWGPDELANRAEISRTALYQIESGKTELPRAGTLRRIAVALNVPMEDLLGHDHVAESLQSASDFSPAHRSRPLQDWIPAEGGPLTIPGNSNFKARAASDGEDSRFAVHTATHTKTSNHDALYLREGELMSKLHDLIHSPMGDGVARLVEELHTLLPRARTSI
ncbi:MAG: helix-turn-helix transcriptional regulator [Isosphaeraceae bacterium]